MSYTRIPTIALGGVGGWSIRTAGAITTTSAKLTGYNSAGSQYHETTHVIIIGC